MPSRVIRPGILTSVRLNSVSRGAELHYWRLMMVVDDYGRIEAEPRIVRAEAWAMRDDVTVADVESWTSELTAGERPLVLAYEATGKKYLEVQDFKQRIRTREGKPAPSLCPAPPCAAVRGQEPPLAGRRSEFRLTEVQGPSAESVGRGAAAESPHTTPTLPALTSEEWAKPDLQQISKRLAMDLGRDHWCPSEIPQAEAAIWREIVIAEDPLAWETAARVSHRLWREGIKRAHQEGILPNSIANKRLAYWFSDKLCGQEPKFVENRQPSGPRSRLGASVERLLGGRT